MAAVGADNADAFGAVHDTAAANGYDGITVFLVKKSGAFHGFFRAGIGRDLIKKHAFQARCGQKLAHFLNPECMLPEKLVGHQENFAGAAVFGVTSHKLPGAQTKNKLRRDKFAQLQQGSRVLIHGGQPP